MADTSSFPSMGKAEEKSFPFMLLHPELRQMIYHEVFSRRGIVLRDRLDPPGTYGCGRRYRHYWLDNACNTHDDAIALLQTSKQVLAEAKPLLLKNTPSHLTLSKNNHKLPTLDFEEKRIADLGLPYQYITHLNLNVKSLGTNTTDPRVCPGISGTDHFNLSCCSIGFGDDSHTDGKIPPDPQRDPNLKGIYDFSYFFATLPALREIHLYDTLKHHLSLSKTCFCPIKGTESCTCGHCQCDCVVHPSLPNSPDASVSEIRDILCNALLSRFRAALPIPEDPFWRKSTDHRVILKTLNFGINIFLHEEIALTVPLKDGKSLHKGLWRATYHLTPPEGAKTPAERPAKPAETPRHCRLRREKEEDEKRRWREQQGLGPEIFLPDIMYDFVREDLEGQGGEGEEGTDERALVEFEAGLQLELVDESEFDTVLEDAVLESRRVMMEKKYGKLWQWD